MQGDGLYENFKKKKIKKLKKRKEDSEEIMEESLAVLDVKPSNIDSLG